MIVGIDEVGRGAWAGPLLVGAVMLGETPIEGLNDSKKLTKKRREILAHELKRSRARVGFGWVSARDIDRIGMSEALKLASRRALARVDGNDVEQIIIDGTIKLIDDPRVTTLKQADLIIPAVSAASIVAKVARDAYMTQMDTALPGYGFAGHVGYGTAAHSKALDDIGPSPIHRMSFAPLKAMTKADVVVRGATVGEAAEEFAAEFLKSKGYEIIERNWKTRWCEIDIVALKGDELHFVEVKYRRNDRSGDGLAAITSTKHKQMQFAARMWLHAHQGFAYRTAQLSAMSLVGEPIQLASWLPQL
jgi:ribonuclease HII